MAPGTLLPPTPLATATRMLRLYGKRKAMDAALDYRFNLYDHGTPGYLFWSNVIDILMKTRELDIEVVPGSPFIWEKKY